MPSVESETNMSDDCASPSMQLPHLYAVEELPALRPEEMGSGAAHNNNNNTGLVDVVVRLKPCFSRLPGVNLPYTIQPLMSDVTTTPTSSSSARTTPSQRTSLPTVPLPSHADSAATLGTSPNSVRHVQSARAPPTNNNNNHHHDETHPRRSTSMVALHVDEHTYPLHSVLDSHVSDAEVCARVVPRVLDQVAHGQDVCIMSVGQVGSGKTHTLNALSVALLRAMLNAMNPATDFVSVSCVQIYRDVPYDLLAESHDDQHHHAMNGARVLGEMLPTPSPDAVQEWEQPCYVVDDATEMMDRVHHAHRMRYATSTSLNARSSRSHMLCALHLTTTTSGEALLRSTILLVDMANGDDDDDDDDDDVHDDVEQLVADPGHYLRLDARPRRRKKQGTNSAQHSSSRLLRGFLQPWLQRAYVMMMVMVAMERPHAADAARSLSFAVAAQECRAGQRVHQIVAQIVRQQHDRSEAEAFDALATIVDVLRKRVARDDRLRKMRGEQRTLLKEHAATTKEEDAADRDGDGDDAEPTQDARYFFLSPEEQRSGRLYTRLLRDCEEGLSVLDGGHLADNNDNSIESIMAAHDGLATAADHLVELLRDAVAHDDAHLEPMHQEALRVARQLRHEAQHAHQERDEGRKLMANLRAENDCLYTSLCNTHQDLLHHLRAYTTQRTQCDELMLDVRHLHEELDELRITYHRECTDNIVREESMAMYNAIQERHLAEHKELKQAYDEQRIFCDALQTRLSGMEMEVDCSEERLVKLRAELHDRNASFASLWEHLTPAQKSRLSDYAALHSEATSPSSTPTATNATNNNNNNSNNNNTPTLHDAHENIQLRKRIRELQRKLGDAKHSIADRDVRLQSLQTLADSLQFRVMANDDSIRSYKATCREADAKMNAIHHQLSVFVRFMDTQTRKQQELERLYGEATTQLRGANEESREHHAKMMDAHRQLDLTRGELITQQQHNEVLQQRVRELEKQHEELTRDYDARLHEAEKAAKLLQQRNVVGPVAMSSDIILKSALTAANRQAAAPSSPKEPKRQILHHMNRGEMQRTLEALRRGGGGGGGAWSARRNIININGSGSAFSSSFLGSTRTTQRPPTSAEAPDRLRPIKSSRTRVS